MKNSYLITCNVVNQRLMRKILLDIMYALRFKFAQFCTNSPSEIMVNPNVTGYSKTDHNVTFGQLLFIGSANSHTHTLPMHCCINGLS